MEPDCLNRTSSSYSSTPCSLRTFFYCRQLFPDPQALERFVGQGQALFRILNGESQLVQDPPNLRRMILDSKPTSHQIRYDWGRPHAGIKAACLGTSLNDVFQLLHLLVRQPRLFALVRSFGDQRPRPLDPIRVKPALHRSRSHLAHSGGPVDRSPSREELDSSQSQIKAGFPRLLENYSKLSDILPFVGAKSQCDSGHLHTSQKNLGRLLSNPLQKVAFFWTNLSTRQYNVPGLPSLAYTHRRRHGRTSHFGEKSLP